MTWWCYHSVAIPVDCSYHPLGCWYHCRADSRFSPNQWETTLLYNDVSLYIPVIILHLSIIAKKFYCNDNTITEFGIIDSKNSSTAYVILYELIDIWVLDSNRRVVVWSLPWRWHILSIPLTTGRGTGAETCGLDDVFPLDDLCSRPEALR